jgi:catechol 2,3-dioxygenase-like lactoylglutathione lyase family enzyme
MAEARKANFNFSKLVVRDLDRCAAFYRDVCGLTEIARVDADIAGRPIREIMYHPTSEGGAQFVLLTFPNEAPPPAGEMIVGMQTADLAAFLERAQKAGGKVEQAPRIIEDYKVKVAFVRDVEGHLIEVVQPY